jgi:hypothetical protein
MHESHYKEIRSAMKKETGDGRWIKMGYYVKPKYKKKQRVKEK